MDDLYLLQSISHSIDLVHHSLLSKVNEKVMVYIVLVQMVTFIKVNL